MCSLRARLLVGMVALVAAGLRGARRHLRGAAVVPARPRRPAGACRRSVRSPRAAASTAAATGGFPPSATAGGFGSPRSRAARRGRDASCRRARSASCVGRRHVVRSRTFSYGGRSRRRRRCPPSCRSAQPVTRRAVFTVHRTGAVGRATGRWRCQTAARTRPWSPCRCARPRTRCTGWSWSRCWSAAA